MEKKDGRGAQSPVSDALYQLPEARCVLVLAPHPDDEALGCGGTIARYCSAGIPVYLVIVSDGGKIAAELGMGREETVNARKTEARKAAEVLGIADTFFLDFPDGELHSCGDRIQSGISAVARQVRPDIVFSPSPVDYHEDHIAVADAAMRLLQEGIVSRVAFYEVYETVRFNALVDISGFQDTKQRAVSAYQQSLFRVPDLFFDAISGMNRSRALYTRDHKGIYEAFWIVSSPLTRNEMISHLTYGMVPDDPASLFLGRLKAVDQMLHSLRNCRQESATQEHEISVLRRTLEQAVREREELKNRVDAMSEGLAWKVIRKYYRLRDRLLPQHSHLRRLYEKTTSLFR